jgi:hypothetical protein
VLHLGPESTKFSVEVHYGDYFVWSGQIVSYVDEKAPFDLIIWIEITSTLRQ